MKLFIQKFLLLPSLLLTNIIFLVSNYSAPEANNNAKYSIKYEEIETQTEQSSSENIHTHKKTETPLTKIGKVFATPNHISLIIKSNNYNLTHKNYISSL